MEMDTDDLILPSLSKKTGEIGDSFARENDERFFILLELLRRGKTIDELHELTKIHPVFSLILNAWLPLRKRFLRPIFPG